MVAASALELAARPFRPGRRTGSFPGLRRGPFPRFRGQEEAPLEVWNSRASLADAARSDAWGSCAPTGAARGGGLRAGRVTDLLLGGARRRWRRPDAASGAAASFSRPTAPWPTPSCGGSGAGTAARGGGRGPGVPGDRPWMRPWGPLRARERQRWSPEGERASMRARGRALTAPGGRAQQVDAAELVATDGRHGGPRHIEETPRRAGSAGRLLAGADAGGARVSSAPPGRTVRRSAVAAPTSPRPCLPRPRRLARQLWKDWPASSRDAGGGWPEGPAWCPAPPPRGAEVAYSGRRCSTRGPSSSRRTRISPTSASFLEPERAGTEISAAAPCRATR